MRRIAIAVLGVLFAGSIAGNAQQPTPPTFRAGTTLVDFTVVAVDAWGNPVTDLRRDEISIVEDESSREVAFFQFEGRPTAAGAATAGTAILLPPGTFSNRPEYAPRAPRHLVALVLDLINTSIAGQVQLQTELVHYLKQLPADAYEKTNEGPSNVRVQPMEVSVETPTMNTRTQLVPVKTAWTLNPATTALRIIVRDRFTGRYGTVELPVSR